MSKLQMIIVLRHELSHDACVVAASHASIGTYLTFENDLIMQEWRKNSFVKVIKQAMNITQFQAIRKLGIPHRVFTESRLDNLEVSVGFLPMLSCPIILKDVPLYKGQPDRVAMLEKEIRDTMPEHIREDGECVSDCEACRKVKLIGRRD